jgi:hypothetical protein
MCGASDISVLIGVPQPTCLRPVRIPTRVLTALTGRSRGFLKTGCNGSQSRPSQVATPANATRKYLLTCIHSHYRCANNCTSFISRVGTSRIMRGRYPEGCSEATILRCCQRDRYRRRSRNPADHPARATLHRLRATAAHLSTDLRYRYLCTLRAQTQMAILKCTIWFYAAHLPIVLKADTFPLSQFGLP